MSEKLYHELENIKSRAEDIEINEVRIGWANARARSPDFDNEKIKKINLNAKNSSKVQVMMMEKYTIRAYEKNETIRSAMYKNISVTDSLNKILKISRGLRNTTIKADKIYYNTIKTDLEKLIDIDRYELYKINDSEIEQLRSQAKYIDDKIKKYYR